MEFDLMPPLLRIYGSATAYIVWKNEGLATCKWYYS